MLANIDNERNQARERTIKVIGWFNDGAEYNVEIKLIDETTTVVYTKLLNAIRYYQHEYSSNDFERFVRDTETRVGDALNTYHVGYEYIIVTKEYTK